MERTLKDLCFTINSLSTDFSVLGRSKALPKSIRNTCTRLGIELFDLDRKLYSASFIKNDTKIVALVDKIKEAADEADEVYKELDELTQAVKKVRKAVQQATELISKISEESKDILEMLEKDLDEVERILNIFGIEVDLTV